VREHAEREALLAGLRSLLWHCGALLGGRAAASAELAEIAAAIDAQYASHDFARSWDAGTLADWLGASPLPDPRAAGPGAALGLGRRPALPAPTN
jgi:hypothetical protein